MMRSLCAFLASLASLEILWAVFLVSRSPSPFKLLPFCTFEFMGGVDDEDTAADVDADADAAAAAVDDDDGGGGGVALEYESLPAPTRFLLL